MLPFVNLIEVLRSGLYLHKTFTFHLPFSVKNVEIAKQRWLEKNVDDWNILYTMFWCAFRRNMICFPFFTIKCKLFFSLQLILLEISWVRFCLFEVLSFQSFVRTLPGDLLLIHISYTNSRGRNKRKKYFQKTYHAVLASPLVKTKSDEHSWGKQRDDLFWLNVPVSWPV